MTKRARWLPLAVGATFAFLLTASGLADYRTIHRGLLLQDWYLIPPNADLSASGPDFSRPARDREHTARGLSPRDSALLHP